MVEIILMIVSGAVSTGATLLTWYIKEKASHRSLEQQAMVILLRREYFRVYDDEVCGSYTSRDKLSELNDIYEVYNKLGGNSTVTELHNSMKSKL